MAGIVSENYIKKDIRLKIKNYHHTEDFMRGYITACYVIGAIKKDTLNELKKYLKEKEEKRIDEN